MSIKIFLLYIKWSLSTDITRWRNKCRSPNLWNLPIVWIENRLTNAKSARSLLEDLRIKSNVIYGNHLDDYVHWGSVAQLGQGADLSKIGSKHKPPKPVVVGSKPTGPAQILIYCTIMIWHCL
jgi:hypothetical protein